MAQKEAEKQRAEAELHKERATMAERGDADHELIDDHERDKFAGTSADPAATGTPANGARTEADGPGTAETGSRTEFEQGREVGERVQEVAGNLKGAVDRSVKDQPMATLAIAAVIGFVLGALWKT